MKNGVVQQMQQDRQMGNFTFVEYDERANELQAMGAANWQPPLPVSPCIRVKSTGEIHQWAEFFAARPDLCENCDEQGNTDPAAWMGRHPSNMSSPYSQVMDSSEPVAEKTEEVEAPKLEAPSNVHFNMDEFDTGPMPGEVPPVGMAHMILGVPQTCAKDYTDPSSTKAAMPLPANSNNVAVSDAIKQFFVRQHNI